MITRERTWHPRYGVTPGYGWVVGDGVPDVLVSTATAALELGAHGYAAGVLDNYFSHYVRDDGMLWLRGMQLPQTCRVLTVLALYYAHTRDGALLRRHFARARALATWLLGRRTRALGHARDDPRHGIPQGDVDVTNAPHVAHHDAAPLHFFASAAELYRACAELAPVWAALANATPPARALGAGPTRRELAAHAAELRAAAPQLHADLHAALARTVRNATGVPAAPRCWGYVAEGRATGTQVTAPWRAYAEMLYSGALSAQQVDGIYRCMASGTAPAVATAPPAPAADGADSPCLLYTSPSPRDS